MLFKLLALEISRNPNKPLRQVFLTQSHILAQRVQEYYAQLYEAATLGVGKGGPSAIDNLGLINLDEESDARSDLPARFSELTDSHFPLFVTFNQASLPYCSLCFVLTQKLRGLCWLFVDSKNA